MDDKKYAISVNKPRRSVRIHLMTCGSRKVHMNKKGNQIHIEDLNLETARKINESYEYEDKNFCDLCLKELRKKYTSTMNKSLVKEFVVIFIVLVKLLSNKLIIFFSLRDFIFNSLTISLFFLASNRQVNFLFSCFINLLIHFLRHSDLFLFLAIYIISSEIKNK